MNADEPDMVLTPVVLLIIFLEQLFLPVIVFMVILTCYRIKKKVTQTQTDQEIVTRFRNELTQFDKRHPVQTSQNYSPQMFSEITDIEKRLETVVDNLKAQHRRLKATRKRTVYCSRLLLCHSYVSLIVWVVYIAVSFSVHPERNANLVRILSYVGIALLIVHYLIVLIESYFCDERQYIKKLSTVFSAVERIYQIQNAQPDVRFSAECYHYETRSRTVTSTDSEGRTETRQETYDEKVVTANISESFTFRFWRDHSQAALVNIHKKKITKIKMKLQVLFGDVETARDFDERYSAFKEANKHRDTHVDFSVNRTVPGFEKRLAAYVDASAKAWWINSPCFWLSTVLWLGWIYRLIFYYSTAKTTYDVIKLIYVSQPIESGKSSEVDVRHHRDTELLNSGSKGHIEAPNLAPNHILFVNSLASTKSKIEALLRIVETSGDEESLPLKLVNEAEFMHVVLATGRSQLREAAFESPS